MDAVHAILSWTGNSLVPVAKAKERGATIAQVLTQRRIKVDPDTKGLAAQNGLKVRHCINGGQQKATEARRGSDHYECFSSTADEIVVKLFLADVASATATSPRPTYRTRT